MFGVYILLLETNRLYAGETKWWRMKVRWLEHQNPNCAAAKWTTKYPPIKKLCSFKFQTREASKKFEHELVELLMKQYGLDSVRGGRFNMASEGETWWVNRNLQGVSRFTKDFLNLSEHTFFESLLNAPSLAAACVQPL